jgi:hypothetical protein
VDDTKIGLKETLHNDVGYNKVTIHRVGHKEKWLGKKKSNEILLKSMNRIP